MATMDAIDPVNLEAAGGIIMLVVVFLVRKLASGALKEARKNFWGWAKAQRSQRRQPPLADADGRRPVLRVVRVTRHRAAPADKEAA
jgi:hypothetical protein